MIIIISLLYRKALDALVQARANVANLKEMIAQLRAELGGTVKQTSELLNNLVAKATLRERLKAKFDKGSGTLKAFMELIDSEMEDDLTDSVLLDDHDEMDEEYERIKVTQQLSRKSKTIEESLKDAEKEVVERKSDLERSSEMVGIFVLFSLSFDVHVGNFTPPPPSQITLYSWSPLGNISNAFYLMYQYIDISSLLYYLIN